MTLGVLGTDPATRTGWSVTVSGHARLAGDPLVDADLPEPGSWVDGRVVTIAVAIERVSGRRIVRSGARRPGWPPAHARAVNRRRRDARPPARRADVRRVSLVAAAPRSALVGRPRLEARVLGAHARLRLPLGHQPGRHLVEQRADLLGRQRLA